MSYSSNIIGEPIDDITVAQLNKRSNVLSSTGFRDEKTLPYLINNGAWMKLSSCVDLIDVDGNVAKKFNQRGTDPSYPAQQWVLFGGTTPANGRLKSGLGSYSVGLTSPRDELGLRPMPGLVSINITPGGGRGSLRNADIKIKVNTLEQLDAIDTLYFRLGFSCLLEWGHVMYLDNNGNIQDATRLGTVDIFKPNITKESILSELDRRREQSYGNYDGMLGCITQYNWTALEDGSYDCSIKMTGYGFILDSLKINSIGGGSLNAPVVQFPRPLNTPAATSFSAKDLNVTTNSGLAYNLFTFELVHKTPTSTLGFILYKFKEGLKKDPAVVNSKRGIITASPSSFQNYLGPDFLASTGLGLFPKDDGTFTRTDKTQEHFQYGFTPKALLGKLTAAEKNEGKVDFHNLQKLLAVKVHQNTTNPPADAASADDTRVYMKLGFLLAIMNNCCLLYNENDQTRKQPFVYIDFNPTTNLCYTSDYIFSINPDVCLVDLPILYGAGVYSMLAAKNVSDGTRDKILAAVPGFPYHQKAVPISNYRQTGHTEIANLMEIYISIDHLLRVLESTEKVDSAKNVNFNQFLTQILSDVQTSLGNVNSFSLGYSDAANCVQVVDDQQLPSTSKKSYHPIPVSGLTSVVKSYSINTEASTKIGSSLAIAARDPGVGTSNATNNSDIATFAARNYGIKDRILKATTSDAGNSYDDSEETKTASINYLTYIKDFYSKVFYGYPSPVGPAQIDVEYQDAAINYHVGLMQIIKSNLNYVNGAKRAVTANAVMPIVCNLALPGLSTLIQYQAFTLPGNRLPSQYLDSKGSPKIAFIIYSLNQTVENNSWTTQVRAGMLNIDPSRVAVVNPTVNETRFGGKLSLAASPGSVVEVTRTYKDPAKKALINKYGWPIQLTSDSPKGGAYYSTVVSVDSDTQVYAKNPNYEKQLIEKQFAFNKGKTFTAKVHADFLPLLEKAVTAINAANLGHAVDQFDAPFYTRDVRGANNRGALSGHAFAFAIDVNHVAFPQGPEGLKRYTKALQDKKNKDHDRARVIKTMQGLGIFKWGGDFKSNPDTHHFSSKTYPI